MLYWALQFIKTRTTCNHSFLQFLTVTPRVNMFPPLGSTRLQSFSQWSGPSPLSCTLSHIHGTREMKNNSPPQFRRIQPGKCILTNSVKKARQGSIRNVPKQLIILVICASWAQWIDVKLTAFILPLSLPFPVSLSRALFAVFGLVLWWPYMDPFYGAQLFSAVLNSTENELPNKAHIGNSMSPAGLVIYSKMITVRQWAWGRDRAFKVPGGILNAADKWLRAWFSCHNQVLPKNNNITIYRYQSFAFRNTPQSVNRSAFTLNLHLNRLII